MDIQIKTETIDDKTYQVSDGTYYHKDTPKEVISILEKCRRSKKSYRLLLDYGDTETGRSWEEEYDIQGYIGRSTGPVKIPILIHKSRSLGGGGILDYRIIKISLAKGKTVLYQHSKYHKN